MVGSKTLAFRFNNKNNKKVPIELCTKITDTKYMAMSVIICSQIQDQQRAIDKKGTLLKGIRLLAREDGKVSKKLRRQIDRAIEEGKLYPNNPQWCKNTILSNKAFAKYVYDDGCENQTARKQRGKRLKDKLEEMGKIKTRRRFRPIHNQYYTYKQYLQIKAKIIDEQSNLSQR